MIFQTETQTRFRVSHAFDEACIATCDWNGLVEKTGGQVFMTWHYQKAWWEVFGRGKLIIISAFEKNELIAIAPLFADEGMVYFVGSGGSDYLHFIGDTSSEAVLETMLKLAIKEVTGFLGFLFYHVPAAIKLHEKLNAISQKCGWNFYIEDEQIAPIMSIIEFPLQAKEAVNKKSLLRHEAWFNRNGNLSVQHLSNTSEILPWLEPFFEQHRQRWSVTAYPSLFNDDKQCLFYKKLAEAAGQSGWVRFTVLLFNQNPIAFHFGFMYHAKFLWYKPSFDIGLAKQSPGEVLLKQLLTNAIETGAEIFDFGLGDEAFKQRFATHNNKVINIGMYPPKPSIKESL